MSIPKLDPLCHKHTSTNCMKVKLTTGMTNVRHSIEWSLYKSSECLLQYFQHANIEHANIVDRIYETGHNRGPIYLHVASSRIMF